MPFANYSEFKQFLDGASMALTGRRASTHKSRKTAQRLEASNIRWWRSTGRSDGQSENSLQRNRAYLISYFEAADIHLPAMGLALADGSYIWPDRSVVERSIRDGHLKFEEKTCSFILTDAGRAFLSVLS
jgi:hypothetical protein